MQPDDVDVALERAERALDEGRGLKGTGFWKAVDAARRDRSLAERYADRMARIDRAAFERGVRLRVPAAVGVLGLAAVSALGVFGVVVSGHAIHPDRFRIVAFLVGTGALIVGTHSLAHWIVGRALGIRFTHVFMGGPPPPRPGMKTDYASYLLVSSGARAAMHASGAVVTKVVPFALIPFVPDVGGWLRWLLVIVGLVQIVTDVFLSTKVSDWKKVKRELRR